MSQNDRRRRPEPDAVDDVRTARGEISTADWPALREQLKRVRAEYLARSGPFQGVPDERSADVHALIQSSGGVDDEPLIAELRAVRKVPADRDAGRGA